MVEVDAIGLCGSDIRNLTTDSRGGNYPWIYGHEVVGKVVDVAPGVDAYRVGEMIYVYPLAHCLKCENCRMGHSEQCTEMENYTLCDRAEGTCERSDCFYVSDCIGKLLLLKSWPRLTRFLQCDSESDQ